MVVNICAVRARRDAACCGAGAGVAGQADVGRVVGFQGKVAVAPFGDFGLVTKVTSRYDERVVRIDAVEE